MTTKVATVLLAIILSLGLSNYAHAQKANPRVHEAVETLYETDYNGRAFTLFLGCFGALEGIGLGMWGIHKRPLGTDGAASARHFASATLMAGMGFMQIMHGLLRFEERTVSASTAKKLLDDPDLMASSGHLYLEHRAREAQTTRFWGATITTLQGLAASSVGLELLLSGDGEHTVQGSIVLAAGAIITGIGAIHYIGEPKAERIREHALEDAGGQRSVFVAPTLLDGPEHEVAPGLMIAGHF